jgi:hypothetical protein
MRKILGVLFLVACGGPDWTGSWSGALVLGATCQDGSSGSQSFNVVWNITESGDKLDITPNGGTCGSFTAINRGWSADFQTKACGTTTFDSGKLTLQDKSTMLVDIPSTTTNCSGTFSGQLVR